MTQMTWHNDTDDVYADSDDNDSEKRWHNDRLKWHIFVYDTDKDGTVYTKTQISRNGSVYTVESWGNVKKLIMLLMSEDG